MKNINKQSFENSAIYKKIIKENLSCYFISPHLDDAVFSCASLLSLLVAKGINVTIVNVFAMCSPWPYTLSVYKFLVQCGYLSADKLFKDRLKEDQKVIRELGARVTNLNFVDALWRRHPVAGLSKLLSYFIGEVSYVYPMYRYGLAQGIVSARDSHLYDQIGKELNNLTKHSNAVIFSPLAIGRHVDHVIVRDVCQSTFTGGRVVYWSDYPYEQDRPSETEFIKENHLVSRKLKSNSPAKNDLINGYTSQLNVIFGGIKDHSGVQETYYLKESSNAK